MGVLEDFASWAVYEMLHLEEGSPLTEAANFFIYDTIKVFLLLFAVIFAISLLRTFITPQKVRRLLGNKKEGFGNLLAALLGIPTPFCSCSAVPLFLGFLESGVPLGITFSFLISAPLINEVALALLLGLFGWEATLLYVLSGLTIAVCAGLLIGRMGLEGEVASFLHASEKGEKEAETGGASRISFAKSQTIGITREIAPYLILGIGAGSFIHGFVPEDALAAVAGGDNLPAVPIAVILGIPLYSNAAGTVPLVSALMEKGVSLGTALAFMMSVTALSLPEMIILRRVLKPKLIMIFAAILAISIIATGILFNILL
jgi:uncharacterized membrane protein YraQ (UPF0718 family)